MGYLDLLEAQNTYRLRVRSGWPVETLVLLVLLGVLLFCFQYVTLDKFDDLPPAVRYILRQSIIDEIVGKVDLDRTDTILAGSIVLICFVLAILELLWRRLTLFLDQVLQTDRRAVWVLGLTSVVLVRFYFARGDVNWAGDGSSHMCYAWLASKAFAQGEIPIWTNYLGTGSPYLQFYGFLYFYLVGIIDLFMGSVDVSVKLVLAGSHILSGIGMCLFVTRLCGSRRAGFLAGVVYVASLWHTQQTLMMGRFPLSVFYALMPWPFYCFERLRFQARQILPVMGGGFALGVPGQKFLLFAADL